MAQIVQSDDGVTRRMAWRGMAWHGGENYSKGLTFWIRTKS